MKKTDKKQKSVDWGKKIYPAMLKAGVKTAKHLAEEINRLSLKELGRKVTTPNSVSRWLRSPERGMSEPKGTALMFLIKALKADYILFDESDSPGSRKSMERIARDIVKIEAQKIFERSKPNPQNELSRFLDSDKIPQEDKDIILAQVKRLLERYNKNE